MLRNIPADLRDGFRQAAPPIMVPELVDLISAANCLTLIRVTQAPVWQPLRDGPNGRSLGFRFLERLVRVLSRPLMPTV
jgi:hypothetical protein